MKNDIGKKKKSQINNLNFHLKILEKGQNKPKANKREKVQIRTEINEIENRKIIEKINEMKRLVL